MSKHIALRITGMIAALTAFVVLHATQALAIVDPGLGEGSGTPPVIEPPPPFASPLNWPLIIAVTVAAIAVVGLLGSLQHRRHVSSQHA
jgi:hypothetical protein